VICLDVLRAMVKSPESVQVFFEEIEDTAPAEPAVAESVRKLKADLADFGGIEARARTIVERMALTLQGALLVRDGDPAVADAFCATRLSGDWGRAFGTLPAGVEVERIIARHTPQSA
jgi:putative acyl-CoA dehydrogenase